jgi:fructosamine-3-kinase
VEALARELARQLGAPSSLEPDREAGAQGMPRCSRWRCGSDLLFVKIAAAAADGQLAAEAAGLRELARAGALRVPAVRARGIAGGFAFLALEWIDATPGEDATERRLGVGLAALHAVHAEQFGWDIDNTIGPTPQRNGWGSDWSVFWRDRRLRPQLELAARSGYGRLLEEVGGRLLGAVPALLDGHPTQPSLLHGDLWAGNWCADGRGRAVIFDPAVYYGDRETDLAMTRLFGGFGRAFYEAYLHAAPLPAGHEIRAELYNLYHVLNHANLFGGGYPSRARTMIDRLLAQVHA